MVTDNEITRWSRRGAANSAEAALWRGSKFSSGTSPYLQRNPSYRADIIPPIFQLWGTQLAYKYCYAENYEAYTTYSAFLCSTVCSWAIILMTGFINMCVYWVERFSWNIDAYREELILIPQITPLHLTLPDFEAILLTIYANSIMWSVFYLLY